VPVSLLHVHGDEDVNIPIDGGPGEGISGVDFPSPRQGIRTVAVADGCDAEPETTTTEVANIETWLGCDTSTTVELVTVAGASHAWMGAPATLRPGAPEPFADYDASLASWTFLANHPRSTSVGGA
jgi:polyhydroxybutyrate depolymerase